MAWTTPLTAVANSALTAAQWNASVRDNLLETGPAKATTAGRLLVTTGANSIAERAISTNYVDATQSTTSTSYTDLTTSGPAVTVTTGTSALVIVTAQINNSDANTTAASFEISGASSLSPDDQRALVQDSTAGNFEDVRASIIEYVTGLTAGSNTFTMKYRVVGGTGGFRRRRLTVIAL